MPELSKRRQRQLKAQGYDLAFLSRIQPQGNIDFKRMIAPGSVGTVIIQHFIITNTPQKI